MQTGNQPNNGIVQVMSQGRINIYPYLEEAELQPDTKVFADTGRRDVRLSMERLTHGYKVRISADGVVALTGRLLSYLDVIEGDYLEIRVEQSQLVLRPMWYARAPMIEFAAQHLGEAETFLQYRIERESAKLNWYKRQLEYIRQQIIHNPKR